MVKYLIDENLPFFFPVGDSENFMHVSHVPLINMDTDIWRYALTNNVSDFFYRFLSSKKYPKIIWIRTGNLKKRDFSLLLKAIWNDVEEMLSSCSFIIITEEKIQGF